MAPGACYRKLFTAVIFAKCNKLECLTPFHPRGSTPVSLPTNTRPRWKQLTMANTLAYKDTAKIKVYSNKSFTITCNKYAIKIELVIINIVRWSGCH